MRIFNTILIIGAVLCVAAIGAASASAEAIPFNPVMLDGKRVTVHQVGAISAEPCDRASGCTQAIISLRWDGVGVGQHHVRCANPQKLHTVRAHQGPNHAFAFVFACSKTYRWRLA
jgi:hypothetical protein